MSKRRRNKRQKEPQLKVPKFTKKGKIRMKSKFHRGQEVLFLYDEYDLIKSLEPFDRTLVTIVDIMKHPMHTDMRYLVKFPMRGKYEKAWLPEFALSHPHEVEVPTPTREESDMNFSLLSTHRYDCWGHSFTITTGQRGDVHEGWITTIKHQAYCQGKPIIVSFCVSNKRARAMHGYWTKVLTQGPLPEVVEETGLGEWDSGQVLHPRAAQYRAIPLTP